jgi:glycosyltransferase involved in cell wall biosynthesis
MRVVACSFGTAEYANSMDVLRHSALTLGGADNVVLYDHSHPLLERLGQQLPEFKDKKRGFMLWMWKPFIIQQTLSMVQEGDVVVYCDAGMSFNKSIRPYLKMLEARDILLFRLGGYLEENYRNKFWTKQDCFNAMDCNEKEFQECYQLNAAVQVYKKTPKTMQFIESYCGFCANIEVMDDVYRSPNRPGFIDHRHDQSVLTNLAVLHSPNVCIMRDPSQWGVKDRDPAKMYLEPCIDHHRKKYGPLAKTMVVTPTIGTRHLARCVESVQAQTLMGVEHCVVVDGPEHATAVEQVLKPFAFKKPIHVLVLPFNTGGGGWNGHRVYAAAPFLLNSECVAFLDEDNWYEPDHLLNMMRAMRKGGAQWAFCLRKIVDSEGNFITNDNCESLGSLSHTVMGTSDFLIDTSCMLLKTHVACAASPHWMHKARQGGIEADRAVTRFLLGSRLPHAAVQKHTLNYSVHKGSATSVPAEFFTKGNEMFRYDFSKPVVYIFHFNPEKTAQFLATKDRTDRSYTMWDWQMTLLRDVAKKYTLVNGYTMESMIQPGAVVYISICHPSELPVPTLERKDIIKIVYTIESPNIRHRAQWDIGFMKQHFDHLLTYWTPLLESQVIPATLCLHNTHHLDFSNPKDMALLYTPTKPPGRDVVIVLQRRDLSGWYEINGVKLQCLDWMREHYIKDLHNVTAYGKGWEKFAGSHNIKPADGSRQSTVDLMKGKTFALIIENTTADGYVSEKIYDAFIAGCIPLYYGNNNATIGIPETMYVDLKSFENSFQLQAYLDGLTEDAILAMRNAVLDGRSAVLERVSTTAFADSFDVAYQKCKVHKKFY